jgi:hypothetical protein
MATLIFYLEDGTTLNHTLDEGTTSIGRHPDSVVVLEFASVSGHHAVIELSENGCYITDLKSSNGTHVNGVAIEEAQLNDGDRIGFGDVQAVYAAKEAPPVIHVPPPMMEPQPMSVAAPLPLRAAQRPPALQRSPQVRRNNPYAEEGGGCGTALVIIALFIVAILSGFYMRHHQETGGGNFFQDVADKMGAKIPKLKIEKKAGE